MKSLKLFGAAVLMVALSLPLVSSAHGATATVNVYVQTVNNIGQYRSPSDFSITVSGHDVYPASFNGSSNGTVVTVGANNYYSVTSSGHSGFTSLYSGQCSGTLYPNQTATCIVTQNGQGNYPYPPQPYPQQPPVIITSTYMPSKLPNTGFDPAEASAILAFASVLLVGGGLVAFPYARKVVASIR